MLINYLILIIVHLGEDCHVTDWKLHSGEIHETSTQWHFEFQEV